MKLRWISFALLSLPIMFPGEAASGDRRCCCCKHSSRNAMNGGDRGTGTGAENRNDDAASIGGPFGSGGGQPAPPVAAAQQPGADDESVKLHEKINKELADSRALLKNLINDAKKEGANKDEKFIKALNNALGQPATPLDDFLNRSYP